MNNNWNRNKMRGGNNRGRGHGRGRGSGGFWSKRDSRGSHSRGFGRSGDRSNFDSRDYNKQWTHRPKHDGVSKRLSEKDIGVTEYMSEHEGFNGIIKSRFSDFQVSEINEKGEVAKLTDLSPPERPSSTEDVMEDEDLLLNKYNLEILPMETWDNINKVAMSTDNNVEPIKIDVTGMSKEDRTKIHDTVKKAFGESIVGSTVTENDQKFVVFDKYRKGVRIDNRVKWVWPGEYVRFIVYKENCDTMEAAQRIADRLRLNIKPSMVGYAGTKDRRAKTSQWFSLRKVDPRKIVSACRDLREMRVGNFSFSNENLKLGMLKGNVFRICLRNVTAPAARADAACRALLAHGFINYYGLQRFGSRVDMPTYEIGKMLLQGNFQEAIEALLSEHAGARDAYRAGGAAAALPCVPRGAAAARLLRALALRPHDLLGALDQIARNSRLLYLHAYQSLQWNAAASERLRRLGRCAAPGDLVPLGDKVEDELDNEDESENRADSENGDNSDDIKNTTDETENASDNTEAQTKKIIPVKVLTQEDVDSGKYSIFDVVLPLPGRAVRYPPNLRAFYRARLQADGLALDMKHKYKSYSVCGGYRRVALRPRALRWQHARYSEPRADLLLSDRDELEGVTRTGLDEDGKYKALLLTMTLPTSCYATMALRELLRVDTSSDAQASQNNYHIDHGKEQNDQDNNDVVGEKRKIDDDNNDEIVKKVRENDQ